MTEQAEAKSSRLRQFLDNPRKGLWILTIPMMLGMSLQTIYMLADMIFVGRVSPDALTALAFNMPLLFFAIGVTFGLGSGVTAIIAQFIGAQDKRSADSAAEHAVALGAVLAFIFTFAGLTWGRPLLLALGVPGDLLPLAWSYFQIIAAGYTFMVMSVFFRSILSGEGDMKTPMLIQGAGTVLNIILDPVFIFALGMGVRGAAVATVISQAVAAAIFVYLLFVKEHTYVTFTLSDFRPSSSILGSIFRIGAPASFSFVIMSFGGGVFNRILISFSGEAVAAYQVGIRLDHIFLLPTIAIASSLVTLVGMFYGARRHELVRQIIAYAMGRALIIAVVVGVVFFLFAPQLMRAFSDSANIQRVGTTYLRIIVFAYPFVALSMLTGRSLQGMGLGLPIFILTSLRVLVISAPLASALVYWLQKPVEWVWVAMVVSVVFTSMVALTWLRWGLRRMESGTLVTEEAAAPVATQLEA